MLRQNTGAQPEQCCVLTASWCCFWSSVSSLGTISVAVCLMLSLSDKMLWHVPFDSATVLQIFFHLRFLWILSAHFCNIFCCANLSWIRTFIVNQHLAILNWLNKLQVFIWPIACITKCLLKHFVSVCCTLAKFEAKLDVNMLLLHLHHFSGKICKRHKHDVIKICISKVFVNSVQSHVTHWFIKDTCSAIRWYLLVTNKTSSHAIFKFQEFLGVTLCRETWQCVCWVSLPGYSISRKWPRCHYHSGAAEIKSPWMWCFVMGPNCSPKGMNAHYTKTDMLLFYAACLPFTCLNGFSGLVVSMLASGTQVCGFKLGWSCRIFGAKKSSACLRSEGK